MRLLLPLLLGALSCVGTNAAKTSCAAEFAALGAASVQAAAAQCVPFQAFQECTLELKAGTAHRVAMENALVAFGASLKVACSNTESAPSIKTAKGKIVFDADDHTFVRRRRDTVSLFDMSDQLTTNGAKLATMASDRSKDLAAQGKINQASTSATAKVTESVKTLATTVSKMTNTLEGLVKSANTDAVPCTPGVEYQAGKDKAGKALCKYLTHPCHEFSNPTYFEKAAATRTSNRICAPHTPLPPGQYMVVAGGAFKDNVYKKLTVCTSKEWETVAPTRSSNRQCKAITDCKKAGKYEYKAATATTDAVCTILGQTAAAAARDCVDIKQKMPKLKTGFYYVKNKDNQVRKVWCDQDHQGGGWMLVGYAKQGDRQNCWRSTGDCNLQQSQDTKSHRSKTWRSSDSWMNSHTYYAIRFQGTNRLKGENYWIGKNAGGCAYNHNAVSRGACKRSHKTVSTKIGGVPSFGGACQGSPHGCHKGVGDWPCYNGEVTTHHCHDSDRGWYFHAANKGGSRGSGQCNADYSNCDAALWIR